MLLSTALLSLPLLVTRPGPGTIRKNCTLAHNCWRENYGLSVSQLYHFRKQKAVQFETLPKCMFFPIINVASAKAPHASTDDALLCKAGALDPKKVKVTILVCLRGDNTRVDKGQQAALAGAVGTILANDYASGDEIFADSLSSYLLRKLVTLMDLNSLVQQVYLQLPLHIQRLNWEQSQLQS